MDLADDFWRKVNIGTPEECWPWNKAVDRDGYGDTHRDGKHLRAHRLAYTLAIGPIPQSLKLDHTCHNLDRSCSGGRSCTHRACCNPSHLEPVTTKENLNRSHLHRSSWTHCIRGHEFTPKNTRLNRRSDGGVYRACIECDRRTSREYKARRSGANAV